MIAKAEIVPEYLQSQANPETLCRTAVEYLAKTEYNPVGLLTFLERLSTKSDLMEDTAGIMQTHPKTAERRATIIGELNALNIPIARRKVERAVG